MIFNVANIGIKKQQKENCDMRKYELRHHQGDTVSVRLSMFESSDEQKKLFVLYCLGYKGLEW